MGRVAVDKPSTRGERVLFAALSLSVSTATDATGRDQDIYGIFITAYYAKLQSTNTIFLVLFPQCVTMKYSVIESQRDITS